MSNFEEEITHKNKALSFFAPMTPRGKARPRMGRFGTYKTTKEVANETHFRHHLENAVRKTDFKPFASPCVVSIVANFTTPKSWTKKHTAQAYKGEMFPTGKPDIDNVAKFVLDVMNGIAFTDDKQVVELKCSKRFSFMEGLSVTVEEVNA